MLKLVSLTAAAIFTAEALVMLFLESLGGQLSLPLRVLLDATLLMVCVFPTLYFLVFKEMAEQIRLRCHAEETQNAWSQSLELIIEERTGRLQRANEDLLIEVQERAKAAMAMRAALNETRKGKEQLQAIINAVHDALIVVDDQWRVQIVNRAAEAMFATNAYDFQGRSLKSSLLPWADAPADLEHFFSRERDGAAMFLTHAAGDMEKHKVQMRFGGTLEWNEKPATVLMFYYRLDLAAELPETVSLQ